MFCWYLGWRIMHIGWLVCSVHFFSFFVLRSSFFLCLSFFSILFLSCFRLARRILMVYFHALPPFARQHMSNSRHPSRPRDDPQLAAQSFMVGAQVDLINWIKEIHDGMYKNLVSALSSLALLPPKHLLMLHSSPSHNRTQTTIKLHRLPNNNCTTSVTSLTPA